MSRPRKPDPIDIEVGRQIRIHRTQLRMSQTALGQKLGITFQQVQKYEKGTNRVGASRLVRIADVLNTSVAALTNGEPKDEQPVSRLLVEPHAMELLSHFGSIKKGQLRLALVKLAEAIASRG